MTRLAAGQDKVRAAPDGGKVGRRGWQRWLLVAGGYLLLGQSACDRNGLPPEYRDVAVPAARLSSPDARVRGRALFSEHCALCHGERADGQGSRGNLSVQPANFTDPAWRERMTPRRVYYVIREGIRGTPMPAWKTLDAEQTWDLVAYVMSVAELGPVAP